MPLSPEQQYYLPSTPSITKDWEGKSASQQRYAELCAQGHDIIANQVIRALSTNTGLHIMHLYRIAARVRRAIAVLNQDGKDTLLYGCPILTYTPDTRLRDQIEAKYSSRYYDHFEHCQEAFQTLATIEENGKAAEKFGDDYVLRAAISDDCFNLYIRNKRLGITIAGIKQFYGDFPPEIQFHHTRMCDQHLVHAKANDHFQKLLSATDPKEYAQHMAELDLCLFHAPPLRLGSQTATLMVLAGIHKAMGYDVIPRKTESDHFIDAEMTPYLHYIKKYNRGFTASASMLRPRQALFQTDERFLRDAEAKVVTYYEHIPSPLARINAYLHDRKDPDAPGFTITGMCIENDTFSLQTDSKAQKTPLNRAVDFIGQDEIIRTLALPQGRIQAPGKWQEMLGYVQSHFPHKSGSAVDAPRER